MSLRIRKSCEADFDQWKPLWEGYVMFYEHAVDPSQVTELWQRLHQDDPELFCLVAVAENDQLIGLVHFLYHVNTTILRPKCYLQDLFVDPKARVGGTGRFNRGCVRCGQKSRCGRGLLEHPGIQ
jgi:hypothetical protein